MNKTNGKRDVDELVQENKSSWKKDFVYIKKGKVRSWRVLISLVFLLGASAAIFLAVYYKVQTKSMASTGTATLTWNANAETDLDGYRIYYGETKRTEDCPLGGYTAIIDAGKVTSHTVDNLTEGKTYYFSITAYNTAGAESCFSGETSKYIPVSLVRDATAPIVTGFDIPSTAASLTIPITTFTATDSVGVTGYILTESATAPDAGNDDWVVIAPTTHTFSSSGNKTLYAWAKDSAGNVSTSLSGSAIITLTDVIAPIVTEFVIPATATSPTIPITTFTATDAIGVTGYMLTESATAPGAGNTGWVANAPTTHTFSTSGTKTLYAWTKDAAGNVSISLNNSTIITLDITALPVDATAPILSNLAPAGELSSDTTSATLSFSTDENATCKYANVGNIDYASMTELITNTGGRNHTKTVDGLRPKNSYAYFIRCQDALGNANAEDHQIAFSIKKKSFFKAVKLSRSISVSKNSLSRGETIIERGRSFSKNSLVLLYFSKNDGSYYSPVKMKTNSSGKFSVSYTIPHNKPLGEYSWYAIDTKTGWKSKPVKFKVR